MQVIVGATALTYEDSGHGPVMLLLHGWQDSLRTFDPLVADLAPHFRVVRLDLPGFGQSQLPPSSWGLAEYVDTVEGFLDKLGLKPAVLVGHSLGGRVLIKGVGAGRLSAGHLVLLASAGIGKSKSLRNRAFGLAAKTGKLLAAALPASARRSLRQKLYSAAGSDYLGAGELKAVFVRIVREDLRAAASQIKVPTLLIWGDRDSETPLADGHLLHRLIAGSRLEIIAGAGHFLHHNEPARIAALIREFAK